MISTPQADQLDSSIGGGQFSFPSAIAGRVHVNSANATQNEFIWVTVKQVFHAMMLITGRLSPGRNEETACIFQHDRGRSQHRKTFFGPGLTGTLAGVKSRHQLLKPSRLVTDDSVTDQLLYKA